MAKGKKEVTCKTAKLDRWVIAKDVDGNTVKSVPDVFYMSWKDSKIEWKWCTDIPKDSTIKLQINADNIDIYVCGYIEDKKPFYGRPVEHECSNISYLKSHLQKCIRRGNVKLAILTANAFIQLDMQNFLRRLSIILLEDTILSSAFPVIVWLQIINSNGYPLNKSQIEWLYGCVYAMAKSEVRDELFYTSTDSELDTSPYKASLYKLDKEEQSYWMTMWLRKNYGGMKGDMKMINFLRNRWHQRFLSRTVKVPVWNIKPISEPSQSLHNSDWIIAAIDFHCVPQILPNLADRFDKYSEEEIKQAIWFCSSSKNFRRGVTDEIDQKISTYEQSQREKYFNVWKAVYHDFRSSSLFYLKTSCANV